MNWLSKLEKKYGRYAIHNLMMYLIGGYAFGYITAYLMPEMLKLLTLEPALILKGEIWRIVSWVLVPPPGSLVTIVIMSLLYYSLGTSLEHTWGAFRFNVYIFSGVLFTVIGAFILYFITGASYGIGYFFSTYYINLSIFLAFAVSYPDMELLLYFILPIKIKWLAVVYAVMVIFQFVQGNIVTRVAIGASLLNFVIFFLSSRSVRPYTPKQRARKAKFKQQVKTKEKIYPGGAHHKCTVCGRTELDDPTLEFRYCSKCNGNHEYCQDHLFSHEHIK